MSNNDIKPFLYVSESDGHGDKGHDTRENLIAGSLQFAGAVAEIAPVAFGAIGFLGSELAKAAAKQADTEGESKKSTSGKVVPNKAFGGSDLAKRLANASGLSVYTIMELKDLDYRFPPGHPLPGKLYRLHPLSDNPHLAKGNVYIPSWSYDKILYAEREAELIRLLVCLGAIRISIRKAGASSSASSSSMSGQVTVAGGMAGASANHESASESEKSSSDVRTFMLEGMTWRAGDKLDQKAFGWLPYEPSWGSIVQAREVGGCLQAMIELQAKSSFSSESLIEASLNYGMNSASGRKQSSASGANASAYIIEAEFAKRQPVSTSG